MAYDGQLWEVALPNGTLWEIMDKAAREAASGTIVCRGVSATQLTEGCTTNPINIAVLLTSPTAPDDWATNYTDYYTYDSSTNTWSHPAAGSAPTYEANTYYEFVSRTCVANDAVFYTSKEFVFDGTQWHEFGDMTGLGTLAYKNSGSVAVAGSSKTVTITNTGSTTTFSPQATIDAPTISLKSNGAGSTATVYSMTSDGTAPSWSAAVANGRLTFSWSAGALPTRDSGQSVKTGDGEYEATFPSGYFHGTAVKLTGSVTAADSGNYGVTFS